MISSEILLSLYKDTGGHDAGILTLVLLLLLLLLVLFASSYASLILCVSSIAGVRLFPNVIVPPFEGWLTLFICGAMKQFSLVPFGGCVFAKTSASPPGGNLPGGPPVPDFLIHDPERRKYRLTLKGETSSFGAGAEMIHRRLLHP